ncbi:MAG: molybdopterin-dependent oxidoreductase [Acidobacteriota bacterium]
MLGLMATVRTSCNRDCPDACSLLVTVENGRVTRLRGDPDHPVTRGFLCERTTRFPERQHDPARLTSPLRRTGDGFETVSWDEALDDIAAQLLAIREESGPAAIFAYRCGGSMGLMKHVTDAFFEAFGPVTVKSGDVCSGAGEAAQEADFGISESNDFFDLRNARSVLLWGKNPHVASVHLLPLLKEVRRSGARLALIDPVHHRGTSLVDHYLQPRPGADVALVLGVARRLFETDRHEADAAEYCDNFDTFRTLAMARNTQEWAALAEVETDELELLATMLAEGPATILVGWGMQRRANGAAIVRAVDALAAISGNIGRPGAGVSFYSRRRQAFDTSFSQGLAIAPRTIPEPLFGPGILAANDPPIRACWISSGNPACMLPDANAVAEALRTRELTVVVDSFLTDTAACADYVLPTTTMLEEDDLLGAYGHHWITEARPALPPPPGVLADHEIVAQLAPRLGLGAPFTDDAEAWKEKMLSRVAGQGASLADLREKPAVRNPEAADVVFAERVFDTPSGKANLVTELDPDPPEAPEGQLMLLSQSTSKTQASQTRREEQQGPLVARLHPDSAAGLDDGARAELVNELGRLVVQLELDAKQRPGVVLVDKGGWLSAGRCANVLVAAACTDHGEGAVYLDTFVTLVPA